MRKILFSLIFVSLVSFTFSQTSTAGLYNENGIRSAEEGFKILEKVIPDLILLDIIMPEMDGVNVLHILKKLEDYSIPPVVCLTANVVDGAHDYYKNIGFDEYLGKPIDKSELDRIIKKFLKN